MKWNWYWEEGSILRTFRKGWGQATPEPNENLLHHVGSEQADWQWIHLLIYNLRPELPAHNLLLIMFLFDTPPLCNKIPKFIGLTTTPALILKNCSLRSCLLFAHAQGIGFRKIMCWARCAWKQKISPQHVNLTHGKETGKFRPRAHSTNRNEKTIASAKIEDVEWGDEEGKSLLWLTNRKN